MRNTYTKEFKQVIVCQYERGIGATALCSKYNLPRSIVYDWIKIFKVRRERDVDFTYQDYLDLERRHKELFIELEIIKKLNCLPTAPLRTKMAAMELIFGEYSVKTLCKAMDVDTGTFYNYHFRRVVKTSYEVNNEFLMPKIKEIFEKSKGRFGARKVRQKLSEQNITASVLKVSQLMKQMELKVEYKKPSAFYPRPNVKHLKNELKRNFTQTEPNKAWVGDITNVKVDGNTFYVCVIVDLFSRKAIAVRVYYKNNNNLVMNTFKDAYESRNEPKGLIFHSDRGSQYTSYEYQSLLKNLKVTQSFSNTGNPYDNSVIEAFFSRMKNDSLNKQRFSTLEELKDAVLEYVDYYNDYRPHETLEYKTPNKVELDYYASLNE